MQSQKMQFAGSKAGFHGGSQQRYSPLSHYVKNQGSKQDIQKRITAAHHGINRNNFMRPSSAATKRKENQSMMGMTSDNAANIQQMRQMIGGIKQNDSKHKIKKSM